MFDYNSSCRATIFKGREAFLNNSGYFLGRFTDTKELNKQIKERKYTPKVGDYYMDTSNNTFYKYESIEEGWVEMYTIAPNLNGYASVTEASPDYDKIFEEMTRRFSIVPTVEHKCHNCGGTLEMKADQHIFKCPYCKSAYAIGTAQINARY